LAGEQLLRNAGPVLFFGLSAPLLRLSGEEPLDIFPYLTRLGYRELVLYDNEGYPAMLISATETALLAQLIDHMGRHPYSYQDDAAFHSYCPGLAWTV
jgi:hypothetical protein